MEQKNSKIYILIVVGMVSALGPFVTDFYLPAFPNLVTYFDTTASQVQLSLTFSMIGLAVGQIFLGPVSDKFGRKQRIGKHKAFHASYKPLAFGLGIRQQGYDQARFGQDIADECGRDEIPAFAKKVFERIV